MALNKNPAEAMAIAEQILNGDPNSSAAHRIIVEAADALELPQTAVMSLDTMVKNSAKDKNLAIEFAHAVGTTGGNTGPAERLLAELLRNSPSDGELNQALKDLSSDEQDAGQILERGHQFAVAGQDTQKLRREAFLRGLGCRHAVVPTAWANSIARFLSFGQFFTMVSSDITAVCGSSNTLAASTRIRCAASCSVAVQNLLRDRMASAGFLFNAILALATWARSRRRSTFS